MLSLLACYNSICRIHFCSLKVSGPWRIAISAEAFPVFSAFSTRPSMTDYNRYGKEARPTCIRRARKFTEAVRKNEFNGSRIEYVAQGLSLEMLNGSHVLLDHSSVFEANRSGVFLISGMRDDRLYLLPSNWHSADRNQYHCRHSRTHADVRWNSTLNRFELAVRELVRIE